MTRKFNIPEAYRSSVIAAVKAVRAGSDPAKTDLSPSVLDLGRVRFKIARHFGLCFGVGNAIEIAYKALAENPYRRIFLLSEMIHNPMVNADLAGRGVRFLLSPKGEQLVPFEELNADDIVIVPAFGTSVELLEKLRSIGIDPGLYNATCPFVERVWKGAGRLAAEGYTVVIHGKPDHEETRATFSHAREKGPAIILRDKEEAKVLAGYIRGELKPSAFSQYFAGLLSPGFDDAIHLDRIGVVNQTTMLATETQAICDLLRQAFFDRYGASSLEQHFADTSDTLCYATSENQEAVRTLIASGGDLSIVVGGYNSSNTSHLCEISEAHLPTYYIKDDQEILDLGSIRHLDLHRRETVVTCPWFPAEKSQVDILLTAGASCPDSLVDRVLSKIVGLLGLERRLEQALEVFGETGPD